MSSCVRTLALALTALLATSCGSGEETSLLVTLTYDQAWALTRLEVAVGELPVELEIAPQFRVLLPDAWGGQELALQVWGFQGETSFARGSATVTIAPHREVAVTVALARTGCDAACDSPPTNTCVDASTLLAYDTVGTCTAGVCQYTSREIDCPSCPNCDACATVTCNSPPSVCYASPGTCTGGSCSYDYANGVTCDDGDACTVNDRCATGVCAGTAKSCTTPPPPTCTDGATLRTYTGSGTCTAGECSYPYSDETCPEGCQGGACRTGNCAWGAWSVTAVAAESDVYSNGALAVDADGGLHASYRRWGELMYATKPAGGSWSTTDVTPVGDAMLPTSIAVDGQGGVHVGFYIGSVGNISYATYPVSGGWGQTAVETRAAPTNASSSQHTNGIAVDAARGVHLVYDDEVNQVLRYAYRPQGSVWSFTTVDSGSVFGAAIALDAGGGVHLSYVTSESGLRYARKPGGGSFTTVTVDSSGTIEPTSIKVDGTGRVHICYFATWPLPVKYATRPSTGGWTTETVFAGDNQESSTIGCSLGVDSSGTPHVAFLRSLDDDLYYARRTGSGTWAAEPVDTNGIVGGHPALAVDPDDGIHIIYGGGSEAPMKYAYRPCN